MTVAKQRAQVTDSGVVSEMLHYNRIDAGALEVNANRVTVGMNARDSVEALSEQPGMEWVRQLASDPSLSGRIDWPRLEEAHKQWDYHKSGLTPEGAAIVTAAVVWATWGMASGAGAAAGNSVAVGVGEGVSLAGGGAFLTGTGLTVSSVVGGAVSAGLSALAGQAAVALINNKGDIGKTLSDLGSSSSVKSLVSAVVTGGVLGGLNLNPTGLPTVGAGAGEFMSQLGNNLVAGAARAVVNTAIQGGSLQEALKQGFINALIDTAAAAGANWIGDNPDWLANKLAHAVAGCAAGAARQGGSCSAGAIGAAIGEIAAEAYGRDIDTVQFASMMSSIAAAIAGLDAEQIQIAAQAGANAAANNYLRHDQWDKLAEELKACSDEACANALREKYQRISDAQDRELIAACQGSSARCESTLSDAIKGATRQNELVLSGELPDYYWAGSDFSVVAKLINSPQFKGATSEQAEKMILALAGVALDFIPGVGDAKAFLEAEDTFDYTLAVIGVAGPMGDAVAVLVKQAKLAVQAGDTAKAVEKLGEAQDIVKASPGSRGSWDTALNGQLKPNTSYELTNGHRYSTDAGGRVNQVDAELSLEMMDRNKHQQCAVGKCGVAKDEGGHLIAASLGGAGDRINIIPQDSTLNRGAWRAMENELRDALKQGKSVNVRIDLDYPPGAGIRPDKFFVEANIDGVVRRYPFTQ